jgi:hypothetical protein
MKIGFILSLLLVLAACAPQSVALPVAVMPTNTLPGPTSVNTPYASLPQSTAVPQTELLRLSGQGPLTGETVLISAATRLRMSWNQNTVNKFKVTMRHDSPDVEPRYQEMTLALAFNPSYGFVDFELIPGTYTIEVDTDGVWEIWFGVLP